MLEGMRAQGCTRQVGTAWGRVGFGKVRGHTQGLGRQPFQEGHGLAGTHSDQPEQQRSLNQLRLLSFGKSQVVCGSALAVAVVGR